MIASATLASQAQSDSKVAYQDRQYLGNISYGSDNPVSIYYMPISDIADIKVEYGHTGGKLHAIDDAGKINAWSASFTGMKKVGKVIFSGGLVYNNQSLGDRRWNNTLFVSGHNPFIIGDSIISKFNNETFALDGIAAYSPTDNLKIGIKATYDVGSSATQKDPRPEIKGMRFSLTPGAEYRIGRHTVGLSANVGWLSEEVTHTVVRTTTGQYVFLFQGLGVFESKDAVGYRRKYDGMRYGAHLQYSINKAEMSAISDFIDIGYYSEYENATDGSSVTKYKGGRYSGNGISLGNRLQFRHGLNAVHNVTVSAATHNSTGTWYTQKQSTDADGNLIYEVVNESDNLEGHDTRAGVAYRFDRTNASHLPTVSVNVSADIERTEIKNRIYGAKEDYTNAYISANATKRFAIRKSWLGATVRGGYRMSIDSSIKIDDMPSTYSIIMNKYTRPAFDAMTAGYWEGGLELSYSLPLSIMHYGSVLDIKLSADYRSQTDKTTTMKDADRFYLGVSAGFIF